MLQRTTDLDAGGLGAGGLADGNDASVPPICLSDCSTAIRPHITSFVRRLEREELIF